MTNATKTSFLFRIYGTYLLENRSGILLTGHIQSGTVSLYDRVVYIDKTQTLVCECVVADIEKLPMTKLTKASADEMGARSITMQITGHLEHEFKAGGFIAKLN